MVSFIQLGLWLNDVYIKPISNTKFRFPITKLGETLTLQKESIKIDDKNLYMRCKVQLYSRGIELRDSVLGSEIKTKKQQICKSNQLLVAEIDAKLGGYGIVPSNLEGAIVSSHYFLYTIKEEVLSPEYLGIYLKTEEFHAQIKPIGSTNYAAIRPYHVLEYKIPLPSLEIQHALVATYQDKITAADKAEQTAKDLEAGIEQYLLEELGIEIPEKQAKKTGLQMVRFSEVSRWDYDYICGNAEDVKSIKYTIKKIRELCNIGSGGTPSRSIESYFKGNIPWVKTGEVREEIIFNTEEKITKEALQNSSAKIYPKDSLIVAMYGATAGRTAKLGIDSSTNQACAVLHNIDIEVINPDFLWIYLQSQVENFKKISAGSAQPNLNAQKIANYNVPIPPLPRQNAIVSHITAQKAEIKRLRAEAEALRKAAKEEFEKEIFHV